MTETILTVVSVTLRVGIFYYFTICNCLGWDRRKGYHI